MGAFGSLRLDAITPAALDAFTTGRLTVVSASQVREEITRLSRVLNHARARGVILGHPFRGWKRPRSVPADIRVVRPHEEAALLRAVPRDFADWIAVALDTGLRKGELRVLEAASLSLNGAQAELRLLQPKVKRVKVIPLTPRATACLRRRRGHGTYLFGQAVGAALLHPLD